MAWTEQMVNQLKDMWMDGLTTNEIAKNLGMSKNSVVGKVHRLNLSARPSPIKKKSETPVLEEKTEKSLPLKQTKKIVINPISISEKSVGSNACLKLTELDNHTCRWPIGDPRDDDFCFCGKKVRSGQTYCEEHAAIAFVKPGKKEK